MGQDTKLIHSFNKYLLHLLRLFFGHDTAISKNVQNIVFKTLAIKYQRVAIPERWETYKMSPKITSVYYCLQTSLCIGRENPGKKKKPQISLHWGKLGIQVGRDGGGRVSASQVALIIKNQPANAEDLGDVDSIPG